VRINGMLKGLFEIMLAASSHFTKNEIVVHLQATSQVVKHNSQYFSRF